MPTADPPDTGLADVRAAIRAELVAWATTGIAEGVTGDLADLAKVYVDLGGDLELDRPAIRAELDAALTARAELVIAGERVTAAAKELGADTFEGRLEDLGATINYLDAAIEGEAGR